tara:strand:- start:408858 stop:409988 length:1131 start_codon:yes stop_codon:yes gene_type:complete
MGIKFETASAGKKETKSTSLSEVFNKDITLFGSSFSNKKKEAFYNELSVLLKSGITLKHALELISESQKKEKDRVIIEAISSQILSGKSLHEAMEKNEHFSPYEYHAIKIGEQTGRLVDITNDLDAFFGQKNEQRRQVLSALSYPFIVLITAILVVYFMMRFIVPMFIDTFRQNQVELPWITKVIVSISNFIGTYNWLILLTTFLLPFLLKFLGQQAWFKRPLDEFKLRIPILGTYFKQVYLTQFTQAMSLLTTAKVSVVQGISLVKNMIAFYPLQEALESIEKDIIDGGKLSESFAKHPLFDKKMIALLKVAEETNQTDYIFQKLYEQYSSGLKYRSGLITSILNPIFLVVIAVIVGVILIAMYLPMFKLSSVIG